MKKLLIMVMWLAMIIVMALTAISCQGKTILGGPDIPKEEGTWFIKLGGETQWVTLDSLPGSKGIWMDPGTSMFSKPNDPVDLGHWSSWKEEQKSQINGGTIYIGYRLTPSDKQMTGVAGLIVDNFYLYELLRVRQDEQYPDSGQIAIRPSERIKAVDKSDYKKGYMYLEFILPEGKNYVFIHNSYFMYLQKV